MLCPVATSSIYESVPYLRSRSLYTSAVAGRRELAESGQDAGMSDCLITKHRVVSTPLTARMDAARGSPVMRLRSPKKLPVGSRFTTAPK